LRFTLFEPRIDRYPFHPIIFYLLHFYKIKDQRNLF